MKKNKDNSVALKKVKSEDGAKQKFINRIKTRWLISRTNTFLLIAILVVIFIFINAVIKKIDFTPIDCTKSQDFSLTQESKDKVKNIDQDVNLYFIGWDESDNDYILAKQYNKANPKIKVEIVDVTTNLEIADKYNITSNDYSIIVECGETSRILSNYDIVTYDSSYQAVDIAEQKITSAILNVTSGEIPKVYFLAGYSNFSISNSSGGLYLLSQYLENEVLTYEEVNLLSTQKVPDDCNTLVITTPEKDFDTVVADAIIEYIKNGGNILWFNGAYVEKTDMTNVNRVLAEYGLDGFENGYIYDTDSANTIMGYPVCFMPEIQYTDITKDIYSSAGAIFLYATKINVNSDKMEELNITKTDLAITPSTSYFTTDMTGLASSSGTNGFFIVGAQLVRNLSDESDTENDENTEEEAEVKTSKLIIYGNDYFITDQGLSDNSGNQYYMIYLANNADLCLNSLASLTNMDQDITIRKNYSDSITSFTPTDKEKTNIMILIFTVPGAIIILGIIIWILRQRKK